MKPHYQFEAEAFTRGYSAVAGCDEVGRGAIAGPVVAAAVVLDPTHIPDGIDDSKRLSAHQRERLFERLTSSAAFSVAIIPPEEVDRLNVQQASLRAMALSIQSLTIAPDYALIDGRDPIPLNIAQLSIIRGDQLSLSIAAASIIAKVTRDRLMHAASNVYPQFGFERHKGYGTKLHLQRLAQHGASPIHRRSATFIKQRVSTWVA